MQEWIIVGKKKISQGNKKILVSLKHAAVPLELFVIILD